MKNQKGAIMPKALVILSPGFEEVEAITIIDLLRRASVDVTTGGLKGEMITGSHDIPVKAYTELSKTDHKNFDVLILPGGQPGSNNMKKEPMILNWLQERNENKQLIGAICAAPTVLHAAGITDNVKLTSFPAEKATFDKSDYLEEKVVKDGHIITSRGVGTAIDFALALIAELVDQTTSDDIKKRIVYSG
jgi:4-methyl-5(b-hydroxyethyl)-thiazole monophosphate biosynthesis